MIWTIRAPTSRLAYLASEGPQYAQEDASANPSPNPTATILEASIRFFQRRIGQSAAAGKLPRVGPSKRLARISADRERTRSFEAPNEMGSCIFDWRPCQSTLGNACHRTQSPRRFVSLGLLRLFLEVFLGEDPSDGLWKQQNEGGYGSSSGQHPHCLVRPADRLGGSRPIQQTNFREPFALSCRHCDFCNGDGFGF